MTAWCPECRGATAHYVRRGDRPGACRACVGLRSNAAMTPESRRERARRSHASMTPQARRERSLRANASMSAATRSIRGYATAAVRWGWKAPEV